ncbi:MAG: universal stress protein [Proteobacteria bacterium]|nr:universal stress protein [Pseudomonadota bacterium]MCK4867051.1 universal stress protein [Alphaproteobacteria bacterium]
MPLKDILVYVDNSAQAPGTVAAACSLALRHDAHLTGLAVNQPPEIPGYVGVEIPQSAVEILKQQRQVALDKAREIFDDAVRAAGLTGKSGWSVASGRTLEALSLRSRYADLTVISQSGPEGPASGDDLADDLIMVSGRPILVIPYIGAPAEIGKKVLIAWNASREAARAVSDAMPILESADSIEVFAVEPRGIGDIPGADIAKHLARHGLKAQASKTSGLDIEVGDVLLNQVADSGADLVVMGAYGHSRMRELVLGGATRHILGHMTVPVLLSH